jgi:hypothetical protein
MDVTITHTFMHLPGQAVGHHFQSILDGFFSRINTLHTGPSLHWTNPARFAGSPMGKGCRADCMYFPLQV